MILNHNKHTAKSVLRQMLTQYGTAGTLELVTDVLQETVRPHRGRPSITERPVKSAIVALRRVLPVVRRFEEALQAVEEAEEIEEIQELVSKGEETVAEDVYVDPSDAPTLVPEALESAAE